MQIVTNTNCAGRGFFLARHQRANVTDALGQDLIRAGHASAAGIETMSLNQDASGEAMRRRRLVKTEK